MFGNLGFGEIMLICVVILLLFGAKRIPEVAASMGKGIREFKRNISDVERSLKEPLADDRADRLRANEPAAPPRPEESRPEPKRLIN